MKTDTFDIPAYQFAILNIGPSELDYKEEVTSSMIISACKNAERIVPIPFSNLDGLTLAEVKKYTDIRGPMILYCYVESPVFFSPEEGYTSALGIFYLNNKYIKENQDKQIDKAFEEIIEMHYQQKQPPTELKKVARCFFERYQDKSHEETVDRIKRLEKTKNN